MQRKHNCLLVVPRGKLMDFWLVCFYTICSSAHAGFGENGELLGVPRLTEYLTINSDLNLPRASFADCVQ